MPGDVDVVGLCAVGTEFSRQVGFNNTCRIFPHQWRLFERHAIDSVDPGRNGIEMSVPLVAEVTFAAIDDFIDNLLHPRGAASHLGRDKNIFRPGLILARALEHRWATDLGGPTNTLIFKS